MATRPANRRLRHQPRTSLPKVDHQRTTPDVECWMWPICWTSSLASHQFENAHLNEGHYQLPDLESNLSIAYIECKLCIRCSQDETHAEPFAARDYFDCWQVLGLRNSEHVSREAQHSSASGGTSTSSKTRPHTSIEGIWHRIKTRSPKCMPGVSMLACSQPLKQTNTDISYPWGEQRANPARTLSGYKCVELGHGSS